MKENKYLFTAICLVLIQLLVIYPAITWTQNQFNFSTPFVESLPLLVFMLLAILLVAACISWLVPKILYQWLLPLCLVFSVLIFLQQHVLVGAYGMLDGRESPLADPGFLSWLDLAFWIGGLALCLFFRTYIKQKATLILLFSGLVSVSILAQSMLTYDFASNRSEFSITDEKKFSFSSDKNIMVFLLDGFQSDLFWYFIENEPELMTELEGFQFYPNTAATFAKTYPTIPLLLTGKIYQKQQPFQDFLRSAYHPSLLSEMVDAGWHVSLHPHLKNLLPVSDHIMSNVANDHDWQEKMTDYLMTVDLSLFRSVPHVFKPAVINQGDFLLQKPISNYIQDKQWFDTGSNKVTILDPVSGHRGLDFRDHLTTHGDNALQQPSFKFYHLLMPHSPFLLDRKLNLIDHKPGFSAYQDYAYASLKLMISYLKTLKKLDVYNQSAILILADHGGGEYTNLQFQHNDNNFQAIQKYGHQIASGKPLLLFKDFGQTEPLTISHAPASLVDVMPTLARLSSMTENAVGSPLQELAENQIRTRTYYHYQFTGFDSKYLQNFTVFTVLGHVYDAVSWRVSGVMSVDHQIEQENEPYHLNQVIKFGSDIKYDADHTNRFITNQSPIYNHSSLSTNDQSLRFEIPMATPLVADRTYALEIELETTDPSFKLHAVVNGTPQTAIYSNVGNTLLRVPFIYQPTANPFLNVDLSSHSTTLANTMSISQMVVKSIDIDALEQINEIWQVDFSKSIEHLHPNGFSSAEKWGRWSRKRQASLLFKVPTNFCQNTRLELEIARFYTGVDPEMFTVEMNQTELKLLDKKPIKHATRYIYECPISDVDQSKLVQLTFRTNTTVSPAEIKDSKDVRKLGFGIKKLLFSPISDP